MNNKVLWGVAVVVVVAVVGWLLFQKGILGNRALAPEDNELAAEDVDTGGEAAEETPVDTSTGTAEAVTEEAPKTPPEGSEIVSYTDSGFSPSTLEITVGTTVVFRNDSSSDFWPASSIHPTHKVYPGSDIAKCGTADAENIFDSCGRVGPGEFYMFKFDEVGTWGYHNHIRASETGKIIVEE